MITTAEQFVDINRANVDALTNIAGISLNGLGRLLQLQLDITRSLLEDGAKNVKALASVRDAQDLGTVRAQLVEPNLEKLLGYSRSLYAVTTQSQTEIAQVVEERLNELNKSLMAAIDSAVKSAPAGADVAAAAVKSAVTAASTAFDTLTKAAKQVTELAESSLKATAQAGTKKKVA